MPPIGSLLALSGCACLSMRQTARSRPAEQAANAAMVGPKFEAPAAMLLFAGLSCSSGETRPLGQWTGSVCASVALGANQRRVTSQPVKQLHEMVVGAKAGGCEWTIDDPWATRWVAGPQDGLLRLQRPRIMAAAHAEERSTASALWANSWLALGATIAPLRTP